jgi:hypothetical protein
MRQLHVIGIVALVAGCTGDVDLSGIYRVDVSVASRPCGNDAPVTSGSPYVKLTKADLFGTEYFAYSGCSDEMGSDCASVGGLFGGFFEPIDDGWLGRASFASNSGLNCALGISETTAILDGDQLVIDGSTYQDRIEITEDRCTPEEAEKRGDAMPCTEHERVEAMRL